MINFFDNNQNELCNETKINKFKKRKKKMKTRGDRNFARDGKRNVQFEDEYDDRERQDREVTSRHIPHTTQYPTSRNTPQNKNIPEGARHYQIPKNEANTKFQKETIPLCTKIIKRLNDDASVVMYTSTMLFFGILFFIVVFLLTVYFYTQKQKSLKGARQELDQGDGRGIQPPKVIHPSASPEGQAYIENKERQAMEKPVIVNEPQYPDASTPKSIVQYRDQYGKIIDPSQLNKYVIQEANN